MSSYITKTSRRARECRAFGDIFCRTRRRFNLPVNYQELALAMHRAFVVDWATGLEYARVYVDGWLLSEEQKKHPSIQPKKASVNCGNSNQNHQSRNQHRHRRADPSARGC